MISQILRGAQKSKEDLVNKAGSEVSAFLQKIDIVKEFKKLLREHKISIKADIEFVAKKHPLKTNQRRARRQSPTHDLKGLVFQQLKDLRHKKFLLAISGGLDSMALLGFLFN